MFGSKIDLFNKEWLDVIFASKNKNYGAYKLRQRNSANTTKSLIIASVAFILLFFAPKIYALIAGVMPEKEVLKQTEVVIVQPPPINPDAAKPPAMEPPKPKNDQKKFTPPVVVPDEKVIDEEPPKLVELKKADPGQKTLAGDPDADIVINAPVGEGPKQAAVVEDNKIYEHVNIEQQPNFPGGINAAFRKFLFDNIKYPPIANETGKEGTVYVLFTVEKDGTLSNVRVERKLGFGLDEEAIRVVKKSPRWIPGIQNGNPVRVNFNVPVRFTIGN